MTVGTLKTKGGARARRVIQKDTPAVVRIKLVLTSGWIGIRYLFVPILWAFHRLGRPMDVPYAIDSRIKRVLFPKTEAPNDTARNDARVELGTPGWVQVADQREKLERLAQGQPLLLVAYRGSWCPYSRLHLTDLASHSDRFARLGIRLAGVSSRTDDSYWHSCGVYIETIADPAGDMFRALGVYRAPSLSQTVWGMLLPHESTFLFDRNGTLVAVDTRHLSATKTGQTFLSANAWLSAVERLQHAGSWDVSHTDIQAHA